MADDVGLAVELADAGAAVVATGTPGGAGVDEPTVGAAEAGPPPGAGAHPAVRPTEPARIALRVMRTRPVSTLGSPTPTRLAATREEELMSSALIVVDVQVDFCEGGALGVSGGNAVAESVAQLLRDGHSYSHVIATRDHHIDPGTHFSSDPDFIDSWPPHCVVGTEGQELHPALRGYPFDAVFDKGSYVAAYSGFEGTIGGSDEGVTLAQWLGQQGIVDVDICGIATDYCVRATALDAVREGFDTTILGDLVAAVHPDNVDDVAAELRAADIDWVADSE